VDCDVLSHTHTFNPPSQGRLVNCQLLRLQILLWHSGNPGQIRQLYTVRSTHKLVGVWAIGQPSLFNRWTWERRYWMVYIQPCKHDPASSLSSVARFSRSSSEILASCSNELGVSHILPRQGQIHLLIQSRMATPATRKYGYSHLWSWRIFKHWTSESYPGRLAWPQSRCQVLYIDATDKMMRSNSTLSNTTGPKNAGRECCDRGEVEPTDLLSRCPAPGNEFHYFIILPRLVYNAVG